MSRSVPELPEPAHPLPRASERGPRGHRSPYMLTCFFLFCSVLLRWRTGANASASGHGRKIPRVRIDPAAPADSPARPSAIEATIRPYPRSHIASRINSNGTNHASPRHRRRSLHCNDMGMIACSMSQGPAHCTLHASKVSLRCGDVEWDDAQCAMCGRAEAYLPASPPLSSLLQDARCAMCGNDGVTQALNICRSSSVNR